MEKRELARERIEILFDEAANEMPEHPDRARRYISLAQRIAMRVNLSLPREFKEKVCDGCGGLLVPGSTARVRLDSAERIRIITCMDCGERKRYPYGD